jgi:hypothetical protein
MDKVRARKEREADIEDNNNTSSSLLYENQKCARPVILGVVGRKRTRDSSNWISDKRIRRPRVNPHFTRPRKWPLFGGGPSPTPREAAGTLSSLSLHRSMLVAHPFVHPRQHQRVTAPRLPDGERGPRGSSADEPWQRMLLLGTRTFARAPFALLSPLIRCRLTADCLHI